MLPVVRKLAAFAGLSKSTVSRHLRDLVECGVITRQRRPGGVYDYQIDPRFLPRAPVSHPRAEGVPRQAGQETDPSKQTRQARKRARFAKSGMSFGEIPDERAKWEARLRSWRQVPVLAAALGPEADRAGLLRASEVLAASG